MFKSTFGTSARVVAVNVCRDLLPGASEDMLPRSCDGVNPKVLLAIGTDLGEIEVTVHNCRKNVRCFKKCYGPFGSSEVSDAYGTWGTGTARVSRP